MAESVCCTRCGARVPRGENFCQQCGHTLAAKPQETVVGACYHCGTSWRSGWLFCKTCGLDRERALLRSTSLPAQPASQKTLVDELPEVEKISCKRCGAPAKPFSRFCETCGATLELPKDAPITGKLRTPPAAASLRTQIDAPSQALHHNEPVSEPRYDARATQGDPPPPKIVRRLSPEGNRRRTVAFSESGHTTDLAENTERIAEAPDQRETRVPFILAPDYDTAGPSPGGRFGAKAVRRWSRRLSDQLPRRGERRSKWPLIGLAAMVLLAFTIVLWGWKFQNRGLAPPADETITLASGDGDAEPGASPIASPAASSLPLASPSPVAPAISVPAGMVYVPGGAFEMGRNGGDEAERPVHKVTVKPFFMDRTEVTNEAYLQFIETTTHPAPADWAGGRFAANAERLPVVNVTYEDANSYAHWAGKRLPTEAEWEFAARGTDGRLYPWGNGWNRAFANAGNGNEGRLVEVGGYQSGASPFGALDLCGNAWEWTASKLLRYSNRAEIAPGHVVRGGAFNANDLTSTATYRGVLQPDKAYPRTGFRCVRDVK